MANHTEINREALLKLRTLVEAIHQGDRRGVPLAQLVELGSQSRLKEGITVDFEASRELGQPFVVVRLANVLPPSSSLASLSVRECEVAERIAEGLSNKQIALRLRITLSTVKDHVHRILQKTGLPNRAAVAVALRTGQSAPATS
jgi:DNA-binding NarL/FixJ family response regulator